MLHAHLHLKTESAKKKLTPIEDGVWNCQRCNQHVFECEYRYIFQFSIEDQTRKINVTAFQEAAEQLIGISAEKLYEYEYEANTKKITDIFGKLFFHSYLFKLVVHEETFSNKKQIKCIMISCDKIDHISKPKEDIPIPELLAT
jgi:replication factor A1